MKNYILFALLTVIMLGCSKTGKNNRTMAGVWVVDKFTTVTYVNNVETESKDTTFVGALQLQNTNSLSNMAFFEGWAPFGYSSCNWDVTAGKVRLINFHNWSMDTSPLFSYQFNVEKVTRKTLVLTSFNTDNSLNVNVKYIWKFKRD